MRNFLSDVKVQNSKETKAKDKKRTEFLKLLKSQQGSTFVWVIIGIAATVIVGAFIFIPQLRTFSTTIMTAMSTWWTTVSGSIFQTS